MTVVLTQFVRSLIDSRLMTADEVDDFLDTLPPEKKPADGAELAKELVRQGKLTKFQAQAIYQGKAKGLILGEYIVLDRIGEGGMGQVYKAQHKVMERVVALKTLPSSAMKSERAVQRFHREVKVAARLSHPNVVTAHDAGESQGVHYLVMENVEGSDLSVLVRTKGTVTVQNAINYILQAARGLEYAHNKKVIHREFAARKEAR
jgi:serine/threonine protein kinase